MCKNGSEKDIKPIWNSLEITKIVVGTLTPVAILIFSYYTNLSLKEIEQERASLIREEANARAESLETEARQYTKLMQVTKYRAELWPKISPLMNDLYCYFLYVGHWKDMTPQDIIRKKRELDKIVYSNSPFFSSGFLKKYNDFMNAGFQTGNGWQLDAKLKSPPIREKDIGNERMFASFDGRYIENTDRIYSTYFDWLEFSAEEMDLKVERPNKPESPSAEDIKNRLNQSPNKALQRINR